MWPVAALRKHQGMQQGSAGAQQGGVHQGMQQQGGQQGGCAAGLHAAEGRIAATQQGGVQQGIQQDGVQPGGKQQGGKQQDGGQQGGMQQGGMQQGGVQQGVYPAFPVQQGSMQQGGMQQSDVQQGGVQQQGGMQQGGVQQGGGQQGGKQQGGTQQGGAQQGWNTGRSTSWLDSAHYELLKSQHAELRIAEQEILANMALLESSAAPERRAASSTDEEPPASPPTAPKRSADRASAATTCVITVPTRGVIRVTLEACQCMKLALQALKKAAYELQSSPTADAIASEVDTAHAALSVIPHGVTLSSEALRLMEHAVSSLGTGTALTKLVGDAEHKVRDVVLWQCQLQVPWDNRPALLEALREVFGTRMYNRQFEAKIFHSHARGVAIHIRKAGGHLFKTGGEKNTEKRGRARPKREDHEAKADSPRLRSLPPLPETQAGLQPRPEDGEGWFLSRPKEGVGAMLVAAAAINLADALPRPQDVGQQLGPAHVRFASRAYDACTVTYASVSPWPMADSTCWIAVGGRSIWRLEQSEDAREVVIVQSD